MGSGGSGSRRLRFDSQGEFPRGPRFVQAARDAAHAAAGDPALRVAMNSAIQHLQQLQHPAGYWLDEPHTAGVSETEFLLLAWLNRLDSPEARRCIRAVEAAQLPAGGWAVGTELHGSPAADETVFRIDLGLSVRAWMALKLAGHDPEAEHMQRAGQAIRLHGGAEDASGLTKYWLAMLGQISWSDCPVVLPEELLLPGWLPLGQGELPHWSRSVLLPASIVRALRAVQQPAEAACMSELFLTSPVLQPGSATGGNAVAGRTWRMRATGRTLRLADRLRITPFRRRLIRQLVHRLKPLRPADYCAAGLRAVIWQTAAQVAAGADPQSPEIEQSVQEISSLLQTAETTRQSHLAWVHAPVADTAAAVLALREGGVPAESPSAGRAIEWLLNQELRDSTGGWSAGGATAEPADIPTTALVLQALGRCLPESLAGLDVEFLLEGWSPHADDRDAITILAGRSEETGPARIAAGLSPATRLLSAMARGLNWLLGTQRSDGGWGHFALARTRRDLQQQFTRDGLPPDESSVVLTGQVLEVLGQLGLDTRQPAVQQAIRFCWQRQNSASGFWPGLPGETARQATCSAMRGLAAVGCPGRDSRLRLAAAWLCAQEQHGSHAAAGASRSTPGRSLPHSSIRSRESQNPADTARIMLALLADGSPVPAAARAAASLLAAQQPDGTWKTSPDTCRTAAGTVVQHSPLSAAILPLRALARFHQLS